MNEKIDGDGLGAAPDKKLTLHESRFAEHEEDVTARSSASVTATGAGDLRTDTAAQAAHLANVLASISREELLAGVDDFVDKHGLQEHRETFRKGALVAQRPHEYNDIPELSKSERETLAHEHKHKWHHPFMLYFTGRCLLRFADPSLTRFSGRLRHWCCDSGLGSDGFERSE